MPAPVVAAAVVAKGGGATAATGGLGGASTAAAKGGAGLGGGGGGGFGQLFSKMSQGFSKISANSSQVSSGPNSTGDSKPFTPMLNKLKSASNFLKDIIKPMIESANLNKDEQKIQKRTPKPT